MANKNTAAAGAQEGEISEALIEDMETAGDAVELNTDSLVFDLRDAMLEIIKRLPKPWGATPEAGQRDIAAAAENAATDLVRRTIDVIRSNGKESIRALLVSYGEKGGDVTASLKIKPFTVEESEQAILALHRASGKYVLITVASLEDFKRDRTDAAIDPDAPGLEFEAGDDKGGDD